MAITSICAEGGQGELFGESFSDPPPKPPPVHREAGLRAISPECLEEGPEAPPDPAPWGTPEEIERRRRILLSAWAYAYDVLDESLVSDGKFDAEAKKVQKDRTTGNPKLDRFFREKFVDFSGQWVTLHPEKRKLARLTQRLIEVHRESNSGSVKTDLG